MDNTNPLISIVTISKNAAKFMNQCMLSVLDQEFQDYEYVVIDGGSIDGTREIIKRHSDRIAYWHSEPDRGLTHAFNLGINNSRGKWLLFINADDVLANSEVLSRVSPQLLENSDTDVVFGQVAVVARDEWTRRVGGPYGHKFNWSEFLIMNTIPHQGAFINRDYIGRVGLYNETLMLAADYELFLRAGPSLKTLFVPLLVAYMRDGGVSRRNQLRCVSEWDRARASNKVAPRWRLLVTYFYLVLRVYAGQAYRKFFL